MSARVTQTQSTESSQRAAGSSFYTAMRILPPAQRDAMYAIYSFCRQVDDVADSTDPRDGRLVELEAWRADIKSLYAGHSTARTHDLQAPVAAFGLNEADFQAVIDGMEMDVQADIRAPAWAELDMYCDRVASAVGRLSVRVFGLDAKPGRQLAHHLGRALQLTNILRDLDEDARAGRLYLPREALEKAGIATTEPKAALASPSLDVACAQLVKAARGHFDKADEIMSECPRRAVRAPRIMGEVYRAMLEKMVAQGFAAPRTRVRPSKLRIAWIVARHAFI
jgi:presqualene diphosphate synthase